MLMHGVMSVERVFSFARASFQHFRDVIPYRRRLIFIHEPRGSCGTMREPQYVVDSPLLSCQRRINIFRMPCSGLVYIFFTERSLDAPKSLSFEDESLTTSRRGSRGRLEIEQPYRVAPSRSESRVELYQLAPKC